MELQSLLGGVWCGDATASTPIVSGLDGTTVAVAHTGGLDRPAALRFAREVGGPTLRGMTFAARAAWVGQLGKAIYAHREALLDLSTATYGATRGDGKFDVDGASGTMAAYASMGAKLGEVRVLHDGDAEAMGRSARFVGQHLQMPRHGVGVHINAFNFPAWGMAEKLAVCLLAGVPAVVKPALATAPVAWRIVQIWHDAGLIPPGTISLLCAGAGDLLDGLASQDVVAFTGSSETAAQIRSHARVTALGVRVNVEADSLNASVLGPDVSDGDVTFDMFLADLVRDLTQKAGQKCTAIRRVFVPSDRVETVGDALADALSRVGVGPEATADTRVGALPSAAQRADVEAGLAALAGESRVLAACEAPVPTTGFYVAPRVLLALPGATVVHQREVFGPVATVLPYDGSAEAAVEGVQAGGGGLVASVYTDDPTWAGEVLAGIAPWHGRVHWGSAKVADQSPGPGTVLPSLVHGGPGKAGNGEELGGLRGLSLYLHRVAVQADRALLDRAVQAGWGKA
jgi:oxepin-CoA hydrolase/3-oxo-5,6-dehydrosuberyl-CoA semialdehyde dehydrogenase